MRTLRSIIAITVVAASGAPAFAQDAAGDLAPPTFATTDRQDGHARYGVDLGYSMLDDDLGALGPDSGIRVDVYGQHVVPVGTARAGGYASFAFSKLDADGSDTEITGFELGGIYVIPGGETDFVLHGGLVLPTAGEDLGALITNSFAGRGRTTDAATIIPETTWLRVGASPVFRSGNVFVRVDGGVDLPISSDDGIDPNPLLRFNAAAGFVTGPATLMGELVTIYDTGEDDESLFHTVAVGARFLPDRAVQPMVSAVIPLDDSIQEAVDVVIMLGVQYTPLP